MTVNTHTISEFPNFFGLVLEAIEPFIFINFMDLSAEKASWLQIGVKDCVVMGLVRILIIALPLFLHGFYLVGERLELIELILKLL